MRVVSRDEVDHLIDLPSLIDALHEAFATEGDAPERHHHSLTPGGPVHLLMPAWTRSAPGPGAFLGTKIVNVFPDNGRRGLPAVMGTYLLQSGETGEPLAAIDGTRLTHWRTAAASGLAARFLARPDAHHIVMVGAGALAPFLVRAHAGVRPLDRVTIWNRSRAGAERAAAQLTDSRWTVTVADDLRSAVEEADIVSCATLSTVPLIEGAWLKPGVHVDLVGAFTMGMREADDEALRRASLFADTEAGLGEGGDIAIGLQAGVITRGDVRATLADLCRGVHAGRGEAGEITLFKSVGAAIEDLAAAMLVWRRLQGGASA
jgi:ornithine cyclodeaminase